MTEEWTGGIVTDRDGDGPPAVEEWRSVSVPGRAAGFAGEGPIAYRTTFADPRSDATERALLELRGAYDRATVWLNGTRLATHEPHFVPLRLEFEPESENELVVVCERPDSFTGIYGTDAVPDHFGTPGIWWRVEIESRPAAFVRRFEARPRLESSPGAGTDATSSADATGDTADNATTDGAGAAIDVTLEIDAGRAIDDAVTLSVRPEGFRGGASMERVPVAAAAGERTTVSKTIPIRDPSLWWPREYGPQSRYTIQAKLGGDALERTVGLREIERDDDGLLVNGRRVRARGFTRLPGGDPREDVDRAVDANATLLRTRAHVAPHELYEACDEAGLLVWQDLPAVGSDLPVERGTELAAALAEEYGRHPSLAMYGVQDQPTDPFAEPLGSGLLSRLRLRYRAWRTSVDDGPAREIADSFPDDRPVVATTGAPGTGAEAAHLALGWQYLAADDIDWLLETYPSLAGTVGGFGAGSLADDDADPSDVAGLDAALLERRSADVEGSQREQARTLKTVAEGLRRRGCSVLAASTIRDSAPGGGMGVHTVDGEPKPAAEAIAQSFEPVQAVLDGSPNPGSVGITLCNDTDEPFEAIVGWRAGENTDTERVSVGPLETAAAGSARIPADADRVDLEVGIGDQRIRNRYHL
ncbi:glycoside hydrolase family 2 [Natrinema sp. 1APR25-10V2]|uniref:glycoside hydrolase family 2 n=1 Tax=Natrinema sp. 1APR25-10V2 TaxID=2951081 RepID=UPI002874C5AB|nr:glycoside hydrolase family 2 [Natrinema sp. 1APR25-10V2]MDS0473688.1 glycoside hydrolase family 2 [Natrinema sp. 1APR25-10V2]